MQVSVRVGMPLCMHACMHAEDTAGHQVSSSQSLPYGQVPSLVSEDCETVMHWKLQVLRSLKTLQTVGVPYGLPPLKRSVRIHSTF